MIRSALSTLALFGLSLLPFPGRAMAQDDSSPLRSMKELIAAHDAAKVELGRRHVSVITEFKTYLVEQRDALSVFQGPVEALIERSKAGEDPGGLLVRGENKLGVDGWCYRSEFTDCCKSFSSFLQANAVVGSRQLQGSLHFNAFVIHDLGDPTVGQLIAARKEARERCNSILAKLDVFEAETRARLGIGEGDMIPDKIRIEINVDLSEEGPGGDDLNQR